VALGGSCTFDPATGFDNCQKGLSCSGLGTATGQFACRKFCTADSDCGSASQQCARLTGTAPAVGICVPTCTEFGTSCGAGMTCAAIATDVSSTTGNTVRFLICRPIGTGQPGDTCSKTMLCGSDVLCVGSGGGAATAQCSPLCDTTHVCPMIAGQPDGGTWSCMPVAGFTT